MSDERCGNCDAMVDASRATCPYCRAALAGLALARVDGAEGAIEGGLARLMTDSLLAKDAELDSLMLERELDVAGPLAPSELGAAIARVDGEAEPTLVELESLLAKDAADVTLEGIQLLSLLDSSKDDLKILKRGLTFLKHKRYADALEWWTLQRQELDPARRRFQLLLLLMEAFTCSLAADYERAAQVKKLVREHPVYLELRPRLRREA